MSHYPNRFSPPCTGHYAYISSLANMHGFPHRSATVLSLHCSCGLVGEEYLEVLFQKDVKAREETVLPRCPRFGLLIPADHGTGAMLPLPKEVISEITTLMVHFLSRQPQMLGKNCNYCALLFSQFQKVASLATNYPTPEIPPAPWDLDVTTGDLQIQAEFIMRSWLRTSMSRMAQV